MSRKLKPWAKASFELIVHAELHLRDGGDFDRRMAHIGFDNSIDVAIMTYLNLNPIQRNGKSYKREDVLRWMSNYHTKLEFLQDEAEEREWVLRIPNDEVAYYHGIRNEQYHTGGHGIPEFDDLSALRVAALDTFAMLFGILDVEQVLEECLQERLLTVDGGPIRSVTVDKLLDMDDDPVLIAGQPYAVSEALFATDPKAYATMIAAVTESRNVAAEISDKYENYMRPSIRHVGFVHYEQSVYLKTIDSHGDIDLTDTDFIDEDDSGNRYFSNTRSADENADLLIQRFSALGIVNCFELFTEEAAERIYQEGKAAK